MNSKGILKHDAAVQTAKEVQIFWEKASIPIRPFHHVVKKLKDLVQQFEALKKNKGRSSETQKKNEMSSRTYLTIFLTLLINEH